MLAFSDGGECEVSFLVNAQWQLKKTRPTASGLLKALQQANLPQGPCMMTNEDN